MTRPTRYSSGRWSISPAAAVLVSLLWTVAGFGFGLTLGTLNARAHDRAYCTTYGAMTGTSTRYVAGECWVQYPDTPEYWYPLSDAQGGPR